MVNVHQQNHQQSNNTSVHACPHCQSMTLPHTTIPSFSPTLDLLLYCYYYEGSSVWSIKIAWVDTKK